MRRGKNQGILSIMDIHNLSWGERKKMFSYVLFYDDDCLMHDLGL